MPVGIGGGIFTALFCTGTPHLHDLRGAALARQLVLRTTISTLIFARGLSRLYLFGSAGQYRQPGLVKMVTLLKPSARAGLYVGNQLHGKLPPGRVVQVLWIILISGGADTIVHKW